MTEHRTMEDLLPHWRALESAMSEISEMAIAAGWVQETSQAVWEMIYGDRDEWWMCSRSDVTEELARVKTIAEACGYWIVWDEHGQRPVPLSDIRGPAVVACVNCGSDPALGCSDCPEGRI